MPKKKKEVVTLRMKLRPTRINKDRIHVIVFCGQDEDHYQRAGELALSIGEYQNIVCALGMGLSHMVQNAPEATYIPMQVTVEGEMAALGREDELEGRPDVSVFPGGPTKVPFATGGIR